MNPPPKIRVARAIVRDQRKLTSFIYDHSPTLHFGSDLVGHLQLHLGQYPTSSGQPIVLHVATLNGQIVGVASSRLYPKERQVEGLHILVPRKYRKTGVNVELIKARERYARKKGCVESWVALPPQAFKTYRALGYTHPYLEEDPNYKSTELTLTKKLGTRSKPL